MGHKARRIRQATQRKIREQRLTQDERDHLEDAAYEGSPYHKRSPGDFGLEPPAAPRRDATLCDDAEVLDLAAATRLFDSAIEHGLVSEGKTNTNYPKQLWVVDGERVFEVMYGGSRNGRYHGYPIRKSDPLYDLVRSAWGQGA